MRWTFIIRPLGAALTLSRQAIRFPHMEFLGTSAAFPFSAAVVHSGRTLETVLTGIPPGDDFPVAGGVKAELHEIFRQLDLVLALAGVTKIAVCSVRLYLAELLRDIVEVNSVYREYFGTHPPNRRAYGVTLQSGMLIEAAFVAELPLVPRPQISNADPAE